MDDHISKIVFRYVALLVVVYGFYVILHGSASPGGGFAGGTILAMGFLVCFFVFGEQWRGKLRGAPMGLAIFLLGLGAVVEGIKFLVPQVHGPVGTPGTLFSGGWVSLANFCIGTLVACSILSIIYLLVKEE
ncbi:MAG: MnhB domain-containing protein [Dethiobacteria bacterium]|jgi:multicomponent Na+:H+ antiporter subunit B